MTPLERAARALCAQDGQDPDRPVMTPGFQKSVRSELRRPGEGPFAWQNYLPKALAVLQAIREPSEAMIAAGVAVDEHGVGSYNPPNIWQSMIDAAMEEG